MALNLKKSNLATKGEAGYRFELIVPGTVASTGAFIKVRGAESKIAKEQARKKFKEYQLQVAMDKKRGKVTTPELEDMEDELLELAVSRIISWEGICEDEGSPELEFTPENAQTVLSENTWIRDEILKESNEVSNFQ